MHNKKDEMADLRKLVFRYVQEWKWFVLSVVCCLGLGLFYLKTTQSVYKINANVLIKEDESQSNKGMSALKNFSFGFPGSLDVEDELHVLSSFSIMRQAIHSLKLYTTYYENKYMIKKTEMYEKRAFDLEVPFEIVDTLSVGLKFYVSVDKNGNVDVKGKTSKNKVVYNVKDASLHLTINTIYGNFSLNKGAGFKNNKSYSYDILISPADGATEWYMKNVDIYLASKKANVIALSVLGENIDKNKLLLNKLIELYNNDALIEKNMVHSNTAKFIKNRLEILSTELAVAETAVEQYKQKRKMFNMDLESKALLEQNNDIQPMLIETSSQLLFIEQILEYLKDKENKYTLLPSSIGVKDEAAVGAIQSYNQVLLERMKLLRSTSENNPAVININEQAEALRVSVVQTIENVRKGLLIVQKELNDRNMTFNNRFLESPTIEKEFLDIKRNQLIKEQLVLFLMEKKEENALTLAVTAPKAKIIDRAYNNSKPVSPNKKMILFISLAFGLFLPIIYFYVIDLFKNTFASKEELEAITAIPVLGEICNNERQERIVVSKSSVTPIAELFRGIRNNLNFILNKKDEKVVLITSTRSGEGKSFVSINLALSLSLTNKRILLIGMDIRNPKISEYMHLNSSHKGITNYLADESVTIDDILERSTETPNLSIICAGPIPPNPGELLLDKRLDDLFDQLRARFDYIIIDSAPVGMVSDSFTLNRVSDMTLYVTRANYTDKQSVNFIESLVQSEHLKKLYMIVNDTNLNTGRSYGYGYGYNNVEKGEKVSKS